MAEQIQETRNRDTKYFRHHLCSPNGETLNFQKAKGNRAGSYFIQTIDF